MKPRINGRAVAGGGWWLAGKRLGKFTSLAACRLFSTGISLLPPTSTPE